MGGQIARLFFIVTQCFLAFFFNFYISVYRTKELVIQMLEFNSVIMSCQAVQDVVKGLHDLLNYNVVHQISRDRCQN